MSSIASRVKVFIRAGYKLRSYFIGQSNKFLVGKRYIYIKNKRLLFSKLNRGQTYLKYNSKHKYN
jgi:hypothetical protein